MTHPDEMGRKSQLTKVTIAMDLNRGDQELSFGVRHL